MNQNLTLPSFIIVGAMKAGTSSLSSYMDCHPKICMPKKEVHFFNNPKLYEKGLREYSKKFNKCSQNNYIIGEKTPTYSYLSDIPEKISTSIPDIKLIWIFRNPVDRAYSNYLHALKNGVEKLSFEQAIIKEKNELNTKNVFKNYLDRSIYIKQVNNYLKYFDKNKMLFIIFEEFKNDPLSELNRISSFLNIEKFDNVKFPEKTINPTIVPNNFNLQILFYTRKFFGKKSYLFKIISKISYIGKKPGYPKMRPEIRNYLIEYFRPFNYELENLISQDLRIWNK